MESSEKIKFKIIICFFCTVCIFTAAACESPSPIIILQDPLVLQEVNPLPRTVIIKPVLEYEPVYAIFRIIEVSEVNGVQKYFLARSGADKQYVQRGITGEIADDAEFKKIIGSFKIVEIVGGFFSQ